MAKKKVGLSPEEVVAQVNQLDKRINKVKSKVPTGYGSNLMKSAKYMANQYTMVNTPEIRTAFNAVGEFRKEATQFFTDARVMGRIADGKRGLLGGTKDFFKNIVDDVKSGDIAGSNRIGALEKSMDADDGWDFDDDDDWDSDVSSSPDVDDSFDDDIDDSPNYTKNVTNTNISMSAGSNSVGQAIKASSNASGAISMRNELFEEKRHNEAMNYAKQSTEFLAQISAVQVDRVTPMAETVSEQLAGLGDIFKNVSETMTSVKDNTNRANTIAIWQSTTRDEYVEKSGFEESFEDTTGYDINALKTRVKDAVEESEVVQMYRDLSDDSFGPSMIQQFLNSPLGMILPMMVPEGINQIAGTANSIVGAAIPKAIMNLADYGRDKGGFLGEITALLDFEKKDLSSVGLSVDNKEVPWDYDSKRALTELIPDLIAETNSILQGGAPKKRFDFRKGKWTTDEKVRDEFDAQRDGAFDRSMSISALGTYGQISPEAAKRHGIDLNDGNNRKILRKGLGNIARQGLNMDKIRERVNEGDESTIDKLMDGYSEDKGERATASKTFGTMLGLLNTKNYNDLISAVMFGRNKAERRHKSIGSDLHDRGLGMAYAGMDLERSANIKYDPKAKLDAGDLANINTRKLFGPTGTSGTIADILKEGILVHNVNDKGFKKQLFARAAKAPSEDLRNGKTFEEVQQDTLESINKNTGILADDVVDDVVGKISAITEGEWAQDIVGTFMNFFSKKGEADKRNIFSRVGSGIKGVVNMASNPNMTKAEKRLHDEQAEADAVKAKEKGFISNWMGKRAENRKQKKLEKDDEVKQFGGDSDEPKQLASGGPVIGTKRNPLALSNGGPAVKPSMPITKGGVVVGDAGRDNVNVKLAGGEIVLSHEDIFKLADEFGIEYQSKTGKANLNKAIRGVMSRVKSGRDLSKAMTGKKGRSGLTIGGKYTVKDLMQATNDVENFGGRETVDVNTYDHKQHVKNRKKGDTNFVDRAVNNVANIGNGVGTAFDILTAGPRMYGAVVAHAFKTRGVEKELNRRRTNLFKKGLVKDHLNPKERRFFDTFMEEHGVYLAQGIAGEVEVELAKGEATEAKKSRKEQLISGLKSEDKDTKYGASGTSTAKYAKGRIKPTDEKQGKEAVLNIGMTNLRNKANDKIEGGLNYLDNIEEIARTHGRKGVKGKLTSDIKKTGTRIKNKAKDLKNRAGQATSDYASVFIKDGPKALMNSMLYGIKDQDGEKIRMGIKDHLLDGAKKAGNKISGIWNEFFVGEKKEVTDDKGNKQTIHQGGILSPLLQIGTDARKWVGEKFLGKDGLISKLSDKIMGKVDGMFDGLDGETQLSIGDKIRYKLFGAKDDQFGGVFGGIRKNAMYMSKRFFGEIFGYKDLKGDGKRNGGLAQFIFKDMIGETGKDLKEIMFGDRFDKKGKKVVSGIDDKGGMNAKNIIQHMRENAGTAPQTAKYVVTNLKAALLDNLVTPAKAIQREFKDFAEASLSEIKIMSKNVLKNARRIAMTGISKLFKAGGQFLLNSPIGAVLRKTSDAVYGLSSVAGNVLRWGAKSMGRFSVKAGTKDARDQAHDEVNDRLGLRSSQKKRYKQLDTSMDAIATIKGTGLSKEDYKKVRDARAVKSSFDILNEQKAKSREEQDSYNRNAKRRAKDRQKSIGSLSKKYVKYKEAMAGSGEEALDLDTWMTGGANKFMKQYEDYKIDAISSGTSKSKVPSMQQWLSEHKEYKAFLKSAKGRAGGTDLNANMMKNSMYFTDDFTQSAKTTDQLYEHTKTAKIGKDFKADIERINDTAKQHGLDEKKLGIAVSSLDESKKQTSLLERIANFIDKSMTNISRTKEDLVLDKNSAGPLLKHGRREKPDVSEFSPFIKPATPKPLGHIVGVTPFVQEDVVQEPFGPQLHPKESKKRDDIWDKAHSKNDKINAKSSKKYDNMWNRAHAKNDKIDRAFTKSYVKSFDKASKQNAKFNKKKIKANDREMKNLWKQAKYDNKVVDAETKFKEYQKVQQAKVDAHSAKHKRISEINGMDLPDDRKKDLISQMIKQERIKKKEAKTIRVNEKKEARKEKGGFLKNLFKPKDVGTASQQKLDKKLRKEKRIKEGRSNIILTALTGLATNVKSAFGPKGFLRGLGKISSFLGGFLKFLPVIPAVLAAIPMLAKFTGVIKNFMGGNETQDFNGDGIADAKTGITNFMGVETGSKLRRFGSGVMKNTKTGRKITTSIAKKPVGKLAGLIKKIVNGIFSIGPLKKLKGKVAEKLAAKVAARAAKKAGPSIIAKIGGKIAGGPAVIAGLAAVDFGLGAANASHNFKLAAGEKATANMRIASGVAETLSGFLFGLVPTQFILDVVYPMIGTEEELDMIDRSKKKMAATVKEYGVGEEGLNRLTNATVGTKIANVFRNKNKEDEVNMKTLGLQPGQEDKYKSLMMETKLTELNAKLKDGMKLTKYVKQRAKLSQRYGNGDVTEADVDRAKVLEKTSRTKGIWKDVLANYNWEDAQGGSGNLTAIESKYKSMMKDEGITEKKTVGQQIAENTLGFRMKLKATGEGFKAVGKSIINDVNKVVESFKGAFAKYVAKPITDRVIKMKDGLMTIVANVGDVVGKIKDTVKAGLTHVGNTIKGGAKLMVLAPLYGINKLFGNDMTEDEMTSIGSQIKNLKENLKNMVSGWITSLKNTKFGQTVGSAVDAVKNSKLGNYVSNKKDIYKTNKEASLLKQTLEYNASHPANPTNLDGKPLRVADVGIAEFNRLNPTRPVGTVSGRSGMPSGIPGMPSSVTTTPSVVEAVPEVPKSNIINIDTHKDFKMKSDVAVTEEEPIKADTTRVDSYNLKAFDYDEANKKIDSKITDFSEAKGKLEDNATVRDESLRNSVSPDEEAPMAPEVVAKALPAMLQGIAQLVDLNMKMLASLDKLNLVNNSNTTNVSYNKTNNNKSSLTSSDTREYNSLSKVADELASGQ